MSIAFNFKSPSSCLGLKLALIYRAIMLFILLRALVDLLKMYLKEINLINFFVIATHKMFLCVVLNKPVNMTGILKTICHLNIQERFLVML